MLRAITDGSQQREFFSALHYITQENRAEPERAEQQAESAERLERGEIRVLDAMISSETPGSGDDVEAVIGESFFELRFQRRPSIDQKITIALLRGKRSDEIFIGDDELALENTVVQRA